MTDFFNTNTTKTYSISTTKGDYTLTAQDIAKIVAFGERYITWSGSETWVSAEAVADMVATFCTEEHKRRGFQVNSQRRPRHLDRLGQQEAVYLPHQED